MINRGKHGQGGEIEGQRGHIETKIWRDKDRGREILRERWGRKIKRKIELDRKL